MTSEVIEGHIMLLLFLALKRFRDFCVEILFLSNLFKNAYLMKDTNLSYK